MINVREIAEKNTFEKNGKKYCYVKSGKGSSYLVIVLSAHNQYNKYFLFRAFLETQKHDLLFITDDNTWYLDDNKGKTYIDIVSDIAKKYDKRNVVIYGSSMGGYGAALIATKLGINCLLCNPQISLPVSKDYGWAQLRKELTSLINQGRDVDILREYQTSNFNPVFCIVHGYNKIDIINANLFITACKPTKKVIVYAYDNDTHDFPFGRNMELQYKFFDLIFSYALINFDYKTVENSELELTRKTRWCNGQFASYELSGLENKESTWSLRSLIHKEGMYLFKDIGIGKLDSISGVLAFLDQNGQWHRVSPSYEDIYCVGQKFSLDFIDQFNNNSYISNDCWVRILGKTKLEYGHGVFNIQSVDNKNMYFNFIAGNKILCNVEEITPLTAELDIDITQGEVTFSLIYVNMDGKYISINKVIRTSGKYVITEYCRNVDRKKNNAISVRVYPALDGVAKKIKINNAFIVVGLLPIVWTKSI